MVRLGSEAIATHDPTVVAVGNRYLRVSTGPGIPLATSTDLSRWKLAGSVFSKNPTWTAELVPGSTDFWAPDLVRRGNEWRLYYSVSTFGSNTSAIGLAVNSALDPARPSKGWVDKGPVLTSGRGDGYNAIDPQIASDPAGRDWLVYGSFWAGIAMRPLTPDGTLEPEGKTIPLARRFENSGAVEAAYLFAHGGRHYILVSFDACCQGLSSTYHLRLGRSDAFEGPYVDRDGVPLLEGGGTVLKASGIRDKGPGHGSLLTAKGKEYVVYHAYDADFGGEARLRIQELTWDDEGWPRALSPTGP